MILSKTSKAGFCFLFFLSGAAGLIYEVAWSRYLSLILGNTTYAHAIVLAAFLSGLALGNHFFGKARNVGNPAMWYAGLEIAIAVWCACYPFMHRGAAGLVFGSGSAFLSSFAFRAALSALMIFIPTALMGGTFPILIRLFAADVRQTQEMTGLLYAINSLGAVAGSLASSFWLIQHFGIDVTLLIGAALSGAAALGAVFLSAPEIAKLEPTRPGEPDRSAVPEPSTEKSPAAQSQKTAPQSALLKDASYSWALIVVFISGATALILEIAWFRFFAIILGSTLYSFSLMLAAFILGITLGSFAVSRLRFAGEGGRGILRQLGLLQAAFGAALIVTFPFYPRLPYLFVKTAALLQHSESNFWIYQLLTFGFCFALMFIPTFLSGAALPLASQLVSLYKGNSNEGVGLAFSLNLLGTLAGSILGGFFALPLLGIDGALRVSSALALLCGWRSLTLAKRGKAFAFAHRFRHAALALALGCLIPYPAWKQPLLLMNPFYQLHKAPPATFSDFMKGIENIKVLYYRDGTEATVAVLEHSGSERVLKINGKTDASAHGDLGTELLLGHLPMLLRSPRLQTEETAALCIGFGSGISAGAVLEHPRTNLDLVEISPEVMEAAAQFEAFNHQVTRNPNFHLTVDDAKSFLSASRKTYDVIVSEPSNPRMPGVANLFTREFFELCRTRLAEDGVMVQWFHLYSMTDDTVKMILRTFQTVFPYVSVWNSQAFDMMMIGSAQPLALNEAVLRERMRYEPVRKDLAKIGIGEPSTLLLHQLLPDNSVEQIAGTGPLHTDFFPQLEFGAARSLYLGSVSTFLAGYDQRRGGHPDLLLSRYLKGRPLTSDEAADVANLWGGDWHWTLFNAPLITGLYEDLQKRKDPSLKTNPHVQIFLEKYRAKTARR